MNTKGMEKFLEMTDDIEVYLKDQFDHMEEKYDVHDKDRNKQMLMLAFFLYNCHETISSIASEFTNGRLSKSTYTTDVYMSAIQDAQQESYETMHFEDIEDYIESEGKDLNKDDMMEWLRDYFSSRDTFREDARED